MTRQDVIGLIAMLESEYPNSYYRMTNEQRAAKVGLWMDEFREDDPAAVYLAVRLIMKTGREFAPNIGAIREKMRQLQEPEELDEAKAWALVSKACKNGLYGYKTEYEALPPEVQAAVGCPEQLRDWAMVEEGDFQTVVSSNFRRAYRAQQTRRRETAALPEHVRAVVEGLAGMMQIGSTGDRKFIEACGKKQSQQDKQKEGQTS